MAARRDRNRQRRRRGRFGFLYKLLSFLIIFAAILVGCVVFFRVNEIQVMGNSRYSAQEIVEASGVELGDNLFLVNRPQTAQRILRKLSYVENAVPVHRLPDKVEIHITECVPAAALRHEGSWWLLDARGKLLEQGGKDLVGNLPEVRGLHPVDPAEGEWLRVEVAEQTRLEGLEQLLTALKDRDMMGGVKDFIDLNASNVIRFGYGEGLTVVVPVEGDFPYRVFSLQQTLKTFAEQGETVSGTLELTYGDGHAYLLIDQWLPS